MNRKKILNKIVTTIGYTIGYFIGVCFSLVSYLVSLTVIVSLLFYALALSGDKDSLEQNELYIDMSLQEELDTINNQNELELDFRTAQEIIKRSRFKFTSKQSQHYLLNSINSALAEIYSLDRLNNTEVNDFQKLTEEAEKIEKDINLSLVLLKVYVQCIDRNHDTLYIQAIGSQLYEKHKKCINSLCAMGNKMPNENTQDRIKAIKMIRQARKRNARMLGLIHLCHTKDRKHYSWYSESTRKDYETIAYWLETTMDNDIFFNQ